MHIAEPSDKWNVDLKINGEPVEVKRAYSDVFPLGRERTFTGFYADVSNLKPDTQYHVELSLPEDLQPGQFQGLFFENVETCFTSEIAR
jgi:FKBP-type peptidyl-prolyl cis-trans isomerase (trigger factor)